MGMSFRHSVLVTTAVIGLSAVAAVAAPPGANDPVAPAPSGGAQVTPAVPAQTPPAQTAPGMANNAPEATQQSMEARVEQRITDLHQKLQITAAQEPAWKKFAQTMRDNARKMDQSFEQRVDQMQSMNALDNMKSYARVSRQHAEDVQALLPPFQALYSKMSPEQKQAADQVFREDANRGATAGAQHG